MTSQDFSDHGEFVPGREIQVHHEPWRDRLILYCKEGVFADGCRLYHTRPHGEPPYLMVVEPLAEPPLYLVIGNQEAEMIADAIRPRPQVNERHLDDAITVRDRLLTMVEGQQMLGSPDEADMGSRHIATEAELRRHPQVRIR